MNKEEPYVEDHYNSIAEKYDYFYKEMNEAVMPVLIKHLDLKPQHIVADIGSGTGLVAENLFKSCRLKNPVWCVDPSIEMQEVARKRKGIYPVQKTAGHFFSDPKISHFFDRVVAVFSVHHFVNPAAVYDGIMRSLRPGGVFLQLITMKDSNPVFKSSSKIVGTYFDVVEDSHRLLRAMNCDVLISVEEVSLMEAKTKGKLYASLRGRYSSELNHLTDEQIDETIKQLENEELKDFNDDEPIMYNRLVSVTKVEKLET